MIQLLLNKTTPHFQLLPMSKVLITHSRGDAFTVTKKSYNTFMDNCISVIVISYAAYKLAFTLCMLSNIISF